MLNWESNVFPGSWAASATARASRRAAAAASEEKPVAICRLKRVAADYKGEIDAFMPEIPAEERQAHRPSSVPAPPRSPWRAI